VLSSAWAKGGPQHRQASHLSRAMQRYSILSDMAIYSAAISAFEQGQRRQQALHFLRAMRRLAIAPEVVTHGAASSVCERSSSTSRPHISYERCGAMPSRRMWLPTVLAEKRHAASAGLTSGLLEGWPPRHCGMRRGRVREVHEWTSGHRCCAGRVAVSFSSRRSLVHRSSRVLEGMVKFATRGTTCPASDWLAVGRQRPLGRGWPVGRQRLKLSLTVPPGREARAGKIGLPAQPGREA